MVSVKLLVLMVISAKSQIHAEKFDFKSVFQTPKRNYDDFEILERSNFEADDEKPSERANNCIRDEPKAIANAQVLLTFPNSDSLHKQEQNKLPLIESRGYIEPDLLPPHRPPSLYPPYPLRYPPHIGEPPYYYPKDVYYPRLPYSYDPLENGAHFPHGNYIHKEFDVSLPPPITHGPIRTSTPACTSPRTPSTTTTTPVPTSPPAKCCQIYEDLLAIIEKMAHYLLRESPPCNIKFDDTEKLKIAEALNIIIKYLNMKCQDIDVELWMNKRIDLDVDVSLILEDILSVLPITLLQVRCGKLELVNEVDCLLDMVKYIREAYCHVHGLCGIYKNMSNILKPCIFLRDYKFNNFLSKENIKGYLLMDPLNLALYLIHRNMVNEDLSQKKHEIEDLWVNYLYKTQFMNCNEIFAKKIPAIEDIKCTEQLLSKLRKLFLCDYALRLKEKDRNIRGIDSVISFCTKRPIVFPITPEYPPETYCKPEAENKFNLDEVLSAVENYLKHKYKFDPVHHPNCPTNPIIPSFSLKSDSIAPPTYPEPDDCGPINLGQIDPIKHPNLGLIDPIYTKPQYSINFGKTDPFKYVDLGPVEPNCLEPEKPSYINLGRTDAIKEINRGQEQPIYSYQENPIFMNHGQTEPIKQINHGQVEPERPMYINLGNQEPVQPPCLEPDEPIFINLGQTEHLTEEPAPPPPSPHELPIFVPPEEPIEPVEIPCPDIDIDIDTDIPIDKEPEEPELQEEVPIPCEPEDEEPVQSNPPDSIDLGPQEPIIIEPGCMEEIYLLGPDDPDPTNPVNLGEIKPFQGKIVEVGPVKPIYMQPDYEIPICPIDLGPINPVYIQQDDGGVCSEPPINIRSVKLNCSEEPEPTEPLPTEPPKPCDSNDIKPVCEESDDLGSGIDNLVEPTPCNEQSTASPQIVTDKDDCGDKPKDIDAIPVSEPVKFIHPTYLDPNQMVLIPRPLTTGKEIPYPPGCPVVMLYPSQPGSQFNILTSPQPIECLSCCGGCGNGNRKFPADVDALNPIKDKVCEVEGNKLDGPSKETCKYCGGAKVYPNGRRCPFCAPYVKELDYY